MNDVQRGTLLDELAEAQVRDDEALRYPAIESHAAALLTLAADLGNPILWPTGDGAQRLLGVVEVMSHGRARVRGWTTVVADQAVLVVDVVSVSTQAIVSAAAAARAQGAVRVEACAIETRSANAPLPGVDRLVHMFVR